MSKYKFMDNSIKLIFTTIIMVLVLTSCINLANTGTLDTVRAEPFGQFSYKDGYIYYSPMGKNGIYKVNINGDEPARPAKLSELPPKPDEQLSFDPDVLFADKMYIYFYISYGDWVYYSNYSDGGSLYCIKIDGSGDEKVLNASTCDFFIHDGIFYYIDQTGSESHFENNIGIFIRAKGKIPPGFENFGKIRSFKISEED